MKEITVEQTPITRYQTEDGETFRDKRDAFEHEVEIKLSKVESKSFGIDRPLNGNYWLSDEWYKAKNEEELATLLECWEYNVPDSHYDANDKDGCVPAVGKWICKTTEHTDWGDTHHFVTLDKYLSDFEIYRRKITEATKDYL